MHWVVSEFATIYVRMYVCGLTAEHSTEFRGRAVWCCVQVIQQKLLSFNRGVRFRMLPKVVHFVLFGESRVSNSTLQCIKNGK